MLLSIKKHDNGICSSYLNSLKVGEEVQGVIQKNKDFHFPRAVPSVILISNGTGIAPFLGMISENKTNIPVHLFWGGRTQESFKLYEKNIEHAFSRKQIQEFKIAYSQETTKHYVQDLLVKKEVLIAQVLDQGGIIMICGSLAMQHSVLDTLEAITRDQLQLPISEFENNKQLAMDCY
ncbi:MAG: hypothetical protein JKY22_05530 [Flavobacteriaceae bacterium]|nr:hypothetical protein [Flavobacteriaceae bacterium]